MAEDSPEWLTDGMEVGQLLLSHEDPEFVEKFNQGPGFHDSLVVGMAVNGQRDKEGTRRSAGLSGEVGDGAFGFQQ